ncbi:MAG: rhamnulokinase [Lachnospiraceae bacterium]
MKYYLAVDIGASSGRHILGWMEQGRMHLEEVYRFPNGMERTDGHLCWNVRQLFEEIKTGMKKCRELGKIPVSMGIDTWAVDYVLLNDQDGIAGRTYGYRDGRTDEIDQTVYERIAESELYERTGIQKQLFNTVYQLTAAAVQEPEVMKAASCMLMIPDYFNFLLTGTKRTEYTNATTTQLVSPVTKDWDWELIERLGLKKELFTPVVTPGTAAGHLANRMQEEVGFDTVVYHVASHDTASAVAAVPAQNEHFLYISSGTWSLMGTELMTADCSEASRAANLTNEGGYEYRFRYLKNIMGLWMIQNVKKELDHAYDFAELCRMAEEADISALVDCDNACFLAPESMTEAVRDFCRTTGQQIPHKPGELARVIYRSLAHCYQKTAAQLEQITGQSFDVIHVVGGGSNAAYLNQLTADAAGKPVCAGPGEATAIGNLAVQMIAEGELDSLQAARACIYDSFEVKMYQPNN